MKKRKNLTIGDATLHKADKLIELLDQDDLSGLVALLIREEWERRHGPLKLGEHAQPVTKHPTAEHKVDYHGKKPIIYGKSASEVTAEREFRRMERKLRRLKKPS
jgi:hypothetical protein